uniref:TFIIS N-terminal domain-containing protein n=1 Tax=Oryza brachyantha TaxID=4533 RepID=J3MH29_ORYBR
MAAQEPFRRWKPFLPAFASVDAAIEAAEPGLSRGEFLDARLRILEMLCDATDDEVAEELCVVLDDVMIESLMTLEMVPAMPDMLRSTDLAKDVGALRNHNSERVRDLALAPGIVRGWRVSVKDQIVKAAAAMKKVSQVLEPDETDGHLAKILEQFGSKKMANTLEPSFPKRQITPAVKTAKMDPPAEKAPAVAGSCGRRERLSSCSTDETYHQANILEPSSPKKTANAREPSFPRKESTPVAKTAEMEPPRQKPPAAAGSFRRETVTACSADEKAPVQLNVAKRKLRESYQKAEDAKRQRTVQVIEAPEWAKQRQRKMHPILRERAQSRCPSSSIGRSLSRC